MKQISSHLARFFFALALGPFAAAVPALADDGPGSYARDIQPFFQQHCYACHGAEKQEARLRYDQLDGFRIEQQNLWTLVYEKLSAGDMPPEERPRPAAAETKRILDWIRQETTAAEKALGTGSLRRLNRRELSAALRDLTGLAVDYAAALPGDGTIDGFDTGAEALQDAADSVAQAMVVARRATDGIRFLEPPSGKALSMDLRPVTDTRKAFDAWTAAGFVAKSRGIPRPGKGTLIEPGWLGDKGGFEIFAPAPADGRAVLRVKIVVAAMKSRNDIPNPHLWVEVGSKDIDYREITATIDNPLELVYEVQVDDLALEPSGVRILLSNKVEIPYSVEGYENEDRSRPDDPLPGGTGLFRPAFDRKKIPPEEQPAPFLILQSIEIDPDYAAAWPPESWHAELGGLSDDLPSAKRLLALWMDRAWRRPVNEAEQARSIELYQRLRAGGMSFDDALRAAFQSVLLSGPFRYLPSSADPDPVVAQHAVASRLSFMLVGAPPDNELRRLAAAGKLRDPAVLDEQVDRLLGDPRSDAFVRPFVSQWLELGQPITIAMDHIQKQDFRFGRYLKESMREETIAYVAQLYAENRPAKELVQSDWTMMNQSLARHYGYDGIEGGHLRKVKLKPNDPRGGGILSHAGIQSMLCWMGENWLIYRGAWALRHILDNPPPPPPLEVPELIPSDAANQGKTFRELLKQHQEDSKCSVCHKTIDPLGFAFQNFDISGRWREVEHEKYEMSELDGKIAWRGVGKTRPVDAHGRLPRGEEYSSFAECRELVVKNYLPDLVGGLLKNYTVYATGRKADVDDMAEIKQILQEQASRGYPMRDLLKAIVRSKAFLEH